MLILAATVAALMGLPHNPVDALPGHCRHRL